MTTISTTTLGDRRSAGVGPVVIAALVGCPVACKKVGSMMFKNQGQYQKKPRNGCRGLFFAGLFSLALAVIVVMIVVLVKC